MDSILQFYLESAMKSILSILFSISLFVNISAEGPQESTIAQEQIQLKWYEHYQDAVAQAKSGDKPIFILFTGSDWCSWCQKFEKEVLSQATFSNSVADDFVFLIAEFAACELKLSFLTMFGIFFCKSFIPLTIRSFCNAFLFLSVISSSFTKGNNMSL